LVFCISMEKYFFPDSEKHMQKLFSWMRSLTVETLSFYRAFDAERLAQLVLLRQNCMPEANVGERIEDKEKERMIKIQRC